MNAVDARGVTRGSCKVKDPECTCHGYDGGQAGKKCLICGHPPGKHRNKDVSSDQSEGTEVKVEH